MGLIRIACRSVPLSGRRISYGPAASLSSKCGKDLTSVVLDWFPRPRTEASREPGEPGELAEHRSTPVAWMPEQIGRYRILAELGRGAMGSVYLAHDPHIERRVALKVHQSSTDAGAEEEAKLRKRFVLEARAAGRLNHSGVVAVHDAGIDSTLELAFIAMEYVDGQSLARILGARGRLPAEAAAELVAQAADSLGYAHAQGVVHRDIKPANILIRRDGRVKVADFGIAKLAESHTTAGQVLGTPAYMSPEQVEGQSVEGRSDLFSLGSVLYRCLTGESPFEGPSLIAIGHKIKSEDPQPPRDPDVDIPDGLWAVICRALEKTPERRYASGHEFALALDPFRSPRSQGGGILRDLLIAEEPEADRLAAKVRRSRISTTQTGGFLAPAADRAGSSREATTVIPWRVRLGGLHPWRRAIPALAVTALVAAVAVLSTRKPEVSPPPPSAVTGEPAPARPEPALEPPPVRDEEPARAALASSRPGDDRTLAPGEATLVVLHRTRLKSARMSIWVDGEEVWSEPISAGGNFFARTRGEAVKATVPVRPGQRTIKIQVIGSKKRVDSAEITEGSFEAGETRYLRARLIPVIDNLKLAWKG